MLVRKGYQAAVDMGEQLWSEEQARIVWLSRADQRAAWQLFKRYSDREFSFTDCTSFRHGTAGARPRLRFRRAL
ncbi:MAG: hypothetical protein ACETWR_00935 [Anaerolineae bacterium]